MPEYITLYKKLEDELREAEILSAALGRLHMSRHWRYFNFTHDLETLRGTEVEYLFMYLRGKLHKTQIWWFTVAMKRLVQHWGGGNGFCVNVLDEAASENEKDLRMRETQTALADQIDK